MPTPKNVDVEAILAECQIELIKGIGPNMDAAPEAFDFWRKKYLKHVTDQLGNNANWQHDKMNVLPLAKAMGAYATGEATAQGQRVITKAIAETASKWVSKQRKDCSVGGGRYCPEEA